MIGSSALLSCRVHSKDLETFFKRDKSTVKHIVSYRCECIIEACRNNLDVDVPNGVALIILAFEEVRSINLLEQHRHQQAWKRFERSFPRSLLYCFKFARYASNTAIVGSALYHCYKWLDRAATSKTVTTTTAAAVSLTANNNNNNNNNY